jgi:hypothetical protein
MLERLAENSAFQNAFWIFLGIVAGAVIQHLLHRLNIRWQRNVAFRILKAEIELNLEALASLRARVGYLKDRISASQISENDLFISMEQFDYSALGPLIGQGFFHSMLGPDLMKKYFSFSRIFNNGYAETINSMIRLKHEEGKSLDYLDGVLAAITQAEQELNIIKSAKLPLFGVRLKAEQ